MMDPATNPVEVLLAESRRLEAFADFWRQRIEIEKAYLDNLSGLVHRVPDLPGNGQLQGLANKTRKLLIDELEERRRGFAKLNAAFKILTDEFWTEEGHTYFDRWGRAIKLSLLRIDTLAAEIATAASTAERLAIEAREKESSPMACSPKKATQPRSNVLSRFLDKAKTEQPEIHYDTSSFLSADSAYRQKVQKINDEKYIIQNEIMPRAVDWVDQDRKCIAALKHIMSTFSAVHSDLAQVLNVTSSQLCIVSSSVDASMESASLAEKLDEGFPALIQPYRYTSYETPSSLRPATMPFGCPLPDDLDGASIGQRAIFKAFEMILSSAAAKYPRSLYQAICGACKQQGDDINLSALQLESLWDPCQLDGGQGAIDYLAKAPSDRLLVHFLTRLPEPFLPLHDSDIKILANLDFYVTRVFANAGNRMGTARRCILAKLFLTLQCHEQRVEHLVKSHPEGVQIITRTPDLLPHSPLTSHFGTAILCIGHPIINGSKDALVLPSESIKELKDAGLLK